MSNRRCLQDKLEDFDYITALNEKSRKQLLFLKEHLSEEELNKLSSITTGYHIARERYIETVLKDLNPEMYERIQGGEPLPIFSIFDTVEHNATT